MRVLLAAFVSLAVAALAACAMLLRDRARAAERVASLFNRPERPAKPLGSGHYYRRYWA